MGRWDSQPTRFLGKSDSVPTNRVTAPVLIGASPEEIPTQFVNLVADFLRKERGLHRVGWDGSDKGFDKGGPTSHQQILSLPSLNTLTDSLHQVLV